jgi:hypothetical protein
MSNQTNPQGRVVFSFDESCIIPGPVSSGAHQGLRNAMHTVNTVQRFLRRSASEDYTEVCLRNPDTGEEIPFPYQS